MTIFLVTLMVIYGNFGDISGRIDHVYDRNNY